MTILSLDISLKGTGWAYGSSDNIDFGTRDFSGRAGDNARVGRFFREWVSSQLTKYEPSCLVIEKPIFFGASRNNATTTLHGLAWEAHRAAEIRNIPRFEYYPIQIKKFITGNGRAKKEEVIKAVRERGYIPRDDNQADAIALLLLHEEGV